VTSRNLSVTRELPEPEVVREAARVLAWDGVLLYPSDTVYGLACSADSVCAISRIAALKGSRGRRPYIVLVPGCEEALRFCPDAPEAAIELMGSGWPGALTLVLQAGDDAPREAMAEDGTLALRVPGDPLSRAILEEIGKPLVSTSANLTGKPPFVDPSRIPASISAGVDLFISAGVLPKAGPSRILRITEDGIKQLR
jgi:L-threonylcarbamoyladenylate synthase